MRTRRWISLLSAAAFLAGVGVWSSVDAAPSAKCSRADLNTVIYTQDNPDVPGDVPITAATLAGGDEGVGINLASVRVVRAMNSVGSGLMIRGDVFLLAPSCNGLEYAIEVYDNSASPTLITKIARTGDGTSNPVHLTNANAVFVPNVAVTPDSYTIKVLFRVRNPLTSVVLDQIPLLLDGATFYASFNEENGGGTSFRR